jgi:acyl-CoA dehydrogenase
MNELRTVLAETVTRLFADLVTQDVLEAAEQGAWPDELWRAVDEQGIAWALVPESRGGAGGAWPDAYVVIRAAGYHAVPVPLAETVLGAWLLAESGLEVPPGPLTVAPVRREDQVHLERAGKGSDHRIVARGTAARVPWGAAARYVVVVTKDEGRLTVALVPTANIRVTRNQNLAREPRDTLTFEGAAVAARAPASSRAGDDPVRLYGALLRSAQMAGALERILDEAVKHVSVRVQFGRPLARFQAIQHQLAVLAEQTAAAQAAAARAFQAADRGDAGFEIAAAKVRAGEAAGIGASIAHQVHGAIGFTYEHALHFSTRRLWSWRSEFGSEALWAAELGQAAAQRGADALWPYITSR